MLNKITSEIKSLLCEWKTFSWIVFPIGIILIYLDLQDIKVGFLQLHSLNEYSFLGSLYYMYESLMNGKLSGLFGYGTYQYGFVYFFLNFLIALPGLATDHYSWAIFAPRFLTTIFALGLLIFIYNLSRLYLEKSPALLFTSIFATFPAFLFGSSWFHPDVPLTFFLVGSAFYFAKDNWRYKEYYLFALGFFSLAIAFKYQAITAMPLLILYIFYDQVRLTNLGVLLEKFRLFLYSLLTIVIVFILTNPYILHPMGWNAFYTSLNSNVKHVTEGTEVIISLQTKISYALADYYTNVIFLFIAFLGMIWLAFKYLTVTKKNILTILAITGLVNVLYIFIFLNSSWQMYYFPTFLLGLLSLLYFAKYLTTKKQISILICIALIQLFTYGSSYSKILLETPDTVHPDYTTYTDEENILLDDFVTNHLQDQLTGDENILISPYMPFSFEKLNLTFSQVKVFYGALTRDGFDREKYLAGQKLYWRELKSDDELLASFDPIDIIILRKNLPFIETDLIKNMANPQDYWQSKIIVDDLYNGKLGYNVLAENDLVVIFKMENDYEIH